MKKKPSDSAEFLTPKLNIRQLSRLTGKTRETIIGKLAGIPFDVTNGQNKEYVATVALEAIYLGTSKGNESAAAITSAEASRQLTIARKQQIDLEMEVTRRERIPLDVIEAVNDRAFSNAAGILKAHAGKQLTDEAVNDIFSEFRAIGSAVREWSRKEQ